MRCRVRAVASTAVSVIALWTAPGPARAAQEGSLKAIVRPMAPSASGPHRVPGVVRSAGKVPGAGAAASSRATSIQGAVWRSDNAPVPRAVLRLRNVVTGKIEATTLASDAGNFVFNGIPEGTYVIETLSQGGKVLMVGQTFTVAPGETVATFVRLGPKIPWFNGFFGNAAQSVSSAAASTGVTAVAPEQIPPVSSSR